MNGLPPRSESPATLESSLSPGELVPFQGCVIPPLTPQRDFSPEESLVNSSTETGNPKTQDGAPWKDVTECHVRALEHSIEANKQVKPHCENYDQTEDYGICDQAIFTVYVIRDMMNQHVTLIQEMI